MDDDIETVKAALLKYVNRNQIFAIALDMSDKYRAIIRELFPNAIIVIDLYHVIKNALERRNDVRLELWRNAKTEVFKTALYGKRNWWKLFLEDIGKMEHPEAMYGPDYELLLVAHDAFMQFKNIFQNSVDALDCGNKYDDWVLNLDTRIQPYFIPLVTQVAKYRDEILRYCDFGLTNGVTEAKNRTIENSFRNAPRILIETLNDWLVLRDASKHQEDIVGDWSRNSGQRSTILSEEFDAAIEQSKARSIRMSKRRKPTPQEVILSQ